MAIIDQFTDDDLLTWAAAFYRLLEGNPNARHCLNNTQGCSILKLTRAAEEFLHDQPQPRTPRSTVAK